MKELEISTMELIEDLKKQIGDLAYANAILNVKCEKLSKVVIELQETKKEV